MAFDPGAQPRTIVVPGAGTQTLSFALPEGVVLRLESIVATIDASGASSTPMLTIAAPGGAVIARKRQGEAIDAGTSDGSATWALRLADEGGAGAEAATIAAKLRRSSGASLAPGVSTILSFSSTLFNAGCTVTLGTSQPGITVVTPGVYLCVYDGVWATGFASGEWGNIAIGQDGAVVAHSVQSTIMDGVQQNAASVSVVRDLAAGAKIQARAVHNSTANRNIVADLAIIRLGPLP